MLQFGAECLLQAGPALRLIDWAVNTAPWVTTGSYATATRGDTRSSTWLRVEGPFDPTGGEGQGERRREEGRPGNMRFVQSKDRH